MTPAERFDLRAVRRETKKANLATAQTLFPYKVDITTVKSSHNKTIEIQNWFRKHRYYSWKQKGPYGQYYTETWRVFYFADPDIAMQFKLSFMK